MTELERLLENVATELTNKMCHPDLQQRCIDGATIVINNWLIGKQRKP